MDEMCAGGLWLESSSIYKACSPLSEAKEGMKHADVDYRPAKQGSVCVCVCVCSLGSDSLRPQGLWQPGSSVHGISQARILEWVAISFSRGSLWPKDQAHVSSIAGRFFTAEPPGKLSWGQGVGDTK